MYLSDNTIRKYIISKKIIIEPSYDINNIQAAGIRVHLNDKILIPKSGQTIDIKNPSDLEYNEHSLKDSSYTIKPGEFLLTSSIERVKMDRSLVAFIDGRSTIARLGLTIHLSSTTIDGNYKEPRGTTLEMKNAGNFSIIINYKDPVGMIVFAELKDAVLQDPTSQYQGQNGVAPPNLIGTK